MRHIPLLSPLRLLLLGQCVWLAAIAGPAAAQQAPRSQPRPLDAVVAVVNSEVITRQELTRQVDQVRRQLESRRIEVPPADVLSSQVLERMIVDRAQVQMARDYGIRVDDGQLERALANIANDRGLTISQFRAQAEREGVAWERVRRDIRNEILQTRLREREVDSRVQISDADIDAFIAERKRSEADNSEYEVGQILVRVTEGSSAEDIQKRRARAEEVQAAALRAGADFAALAASFSDSSDAMTGGSLGWRSPERLPQVFFEAVSRLQVGGVTIARSPNGFHVLKLLGRRTAGGADQAGAPVQQTRARHILIRVGDNLGDAEARNRIQDLRTRIAAGADFGEIAKQNSADGSAGRGGDLGWILPGDTVPDFEQAMNSLKPGELSQAVRSPFGYHLIQVMERRQDAAPPERLRMAARQALREQRIEEAWQDWLRQLRDSTWVEYRTDEL